MMNEVSLNTAVGSNSLQVNTTGTNNTAVGSNSLAENTKGSFNTAVGANALESNTTGNWNAAFGVNTLQINLTGSNNTSIGYNSLSSLTSGGLNTAIGNSAGSSLTEGLNNTFIGFNAGNNEGSVSFNNTIILGDNNINFLKCKQQTIGGLSDKRDKADIKDIDSSLNLITELKPVMFKWDQRSWYEGGISDGSKKKEKIQTGFLAQDLKELEDKYDMKYLNLTVCDNPERMEASYGNLMMPLIKAFQELTDLVKTQKKQNDDMLADIKNLKDIIAKGV